MLADELDAQLIIIGSRATHKLDRLCRGSVRDELMAQLSRPILVVPKDEPNEFEFNPRCVMVPIEGSSPCPPALTLANDIAAAYAGKLLLLGTAGTSSSLLFHEAEKMTLDGVDVRTLRSSESPIRAIHRAVTEHRADAIVLASPKRSLYNRWFGNTAERVLRDERLPIFVVHGP